MAYLNQQESYLVDSLGYSEEDVKEMTQEDKDQLCNGETLINEEDLMEYMNA